MATEKEAKRKRVFVINDTPELLRMFQELLGDEGFDVAIDRFTVEMGDMLERVKREHPDLMILDYLIGHEELGWQFLQLLKMDRETRDIPVIVCSAAARQIEELRPHLDQMGIEAVLKPFDIDHLLSVIGKVLTEKNE